MGTESLPGAKVARA